MANQKRPKNPSFFTPRAPLVFPKLNAADTKFKAEGEFGSKQRFQLEDPAVQALLAKLTPFHEQALKNGAEAFAKLPVASRKKLGKMTENPLFTTVYDEEENETGEIEFNFKMAASGTIKDGKNKGRKWIKRPTVVNGDDSDLRFLDPSNVIIGLYAKGRAKRDTSGFVRD